MPLHAGRPMCVAPGGLVTRVPAGLRGEGPETRAGSAKPLARIIEVVPITTETARQHQCHDQSIERALIYEAPFLIVGSPMGDGPMSFKPHQLQPMTYGGNQFVIWHYQTDDAAGEVAHPDYFLPAAYMLRKNDFLVVTADITRDPVYGLFIVLRATQASVEIDNFGTMPVIEAGGLSFRTTKRKANPRPEAAQRSRPARAGQGARRSKSVRANKDATPNSKRAEAGRPEALA